jgi:integrase/recombinase XerD
MKTRNWALAQRQVRIWETEGGGNVVVIPVAGTIAELREKFIEDARHGRHLASETLRKYIHLFNQLEAFCKERSIRTVRGLTLDALSAFRASWTDGARSSLKKLERLRSVMSWAVERKMIDTNPAKGLTRPKVKDVPTLPFTDEEVEKIYEALEGDSRLAAFVDVLLYAGLRMSDATILRVDALQNGKLYLYAHKTGTQVCVPLPKNVINSLNGVKHRNPDYYFWTGHSKVQAATSVWRKRLAELFTKAKIAGHPHRFRDTFAVRLLRCSVSLENVSVLLGHESVKTTQRHYSAWVHSRQEVLEREVHRALTMGDEIF